MAYTGYTVKDIPGYEYNATSTTDNLFVISDDNNYRWGELVLPDWYSNTTSISISQSNLGGELRTD